MVAAAVLVAAGAVPAVAGPARAASAQTNDRTPFVQSLCPGTVAVYPPFGSPAQSSAYYGVALASRISGGSLTVGRVARTTGMTATICGLLKFPELTATIPGVGCTVATEASGCISFGVATTTLDGMVDLPTTFTPGRTDVVVDKTPAANGGLQLSITSQVTTHVHMARFGVDCSVGPITVNLTTGVSGPLQGQAVTGPLTLATARIVGASFAVPGASASTTCPSQLVPATDQLVGLPAPVGSARFSAPLQLANSLQ